MEEVTSAVAVRLKHRDRLAFVFRLIGAIVGLALVAWAFATSAWAQGWTVALTLLLVVGGAFADHLLTSIARCPNCRSRVVNLSIGPADAPRKLFPCTNCGGMAYLTEGFYWQRDVSG